jgi:ABC-type multidrug transport system ATPase subunit
VDGISFAVWAGEIFGFLGLNGAGKTITINFVTLANVKRKWIL